MRKYRSAFVALTLTLTACGAASSHRIEDVHDLADDACDIIQPACSACSLTQQNNGDE